MPTLRGHRGGDVCPPFNARKKSRRKAGSMVDCD